MAERGKKPGFWTTLPGILTGVAALLTAITGLILGLYQYGALGSKAGSAGRPAAADPPTTATAPEASKPGGGSAMSPPAAAPAQSKTAEATVLLTARDGTATPVFADSLRQIREWDKSLHLLNGQNVAFDKIRTIEVASVYEQQAKVRITLIDGRVIEGFVGSGSSTLGFHGENDLGLFDIRMEQLQRIDFRR